jgi:uncharacterized protein (TIGR00369 family)
MKEDSLPPPSEQNLRALNSSEHARCFTHRSKETGGLGVQFHVMENGDVQAEWACAEGYESYEGVLHGGLQATLMDSAMVQALFARGIVARTGEMTVRYHASVSPTQPLTVTAHVDMAHPPLYKLNAAITQNGVLCSSAKAKFMSMAAFRRELPVDRAANGL